MNKCKTCGTENLEGSQYCDECGAGLSVSDEMKTRVSHASFPEDSKVQSASVTSVGIPMFIDEHRSVVSDDEEDGSGALKDSGILAKLVIERGTAVGSEFPISNDESYIGRWDADNGIFPDVDLDAHDPEAKVSRRHARIKFIDHQFVIEDLGSTNGTFVNRGRRLIPGSPHILSDGDEIIVGKTFLRFSII